MVAIPRDVDAAMSDRFKVGTINHTFILPFDDDNASKNPATRCWLASQYVNAKKIQIN